MKMRTVFLRSMLSFFIGLFLIISCSEKENPVSEEQMPAVKMADLQNMGTSGREADDLDKIQSMAGTSGDQPDINDYELVLKDDDNYYYFLNRKNPEVNRYYIGKAYYLAKYYRGECKVLNKSNSALTIYYIDSRFNKACLITGDISVDSQVRPSGYGLLYFQPTDFVGGLYISTYKGSL